MNANGSPSPESVSSPTAWVLPIVQDNQGNKYEVVWVDPVHPDCRTITPQQVQSFVRGLPHDTDNAAPAWKIGQMMGSILFRVKGVDVRRN